MILQTDLKSSFATIANFFDEMSKKSQTRLNTLTLTERVQSRKFSQITPPKYLSKLNQNPTNFDK